MIDVLRFDSAAVLLTGAAAGIGRSCCEVLADLDARVVAVDIDPAFGGHQFVTRNGTQWPESHFLADVSAERDVQELARSVQASHGQLAAVVNVAGTGAYSAAKAGIVGFTRAAAIEGAAMGVRANSVCPEKPPSH